MSQTGNSRSPRARDYIAVPQYDHPRAVEWSLPAHVDDRHIGKNLQYLAQRKAGNVQDVPRAPGKAPVTTFPTARNFRDAVAKADFSAAATPSPNVPHSGNPRQFHVADEFCAWGLAGKQKAFQKLLRESPNMEGWTLGLLNQREIDFFITKEVMMAQGPKEATVFGVLSTTPTNVKLNDEALKHLGAKKLQQAVNPSWRGWRPVTSSTKYGIVSIENKEILLRRGSGAVKAVKYLPLLLSVVIETTFFALEWKRSNNKIVHVFDYATQLALIVGGFCSCAAVDVGMLSIGLSVGAAAAATLGVGIVFALAGVAMKALFSWIQSKFQRSASVYHYSLDFYEMLPLYTEAKVFQDVSFDVSQMYRGVDVFNGTDLFTSVSYFGSN